MQVKPNFPRALTILTALLLTIIVLAPSVAARDQVEYGRYLGTRLRMYSEAHEVLDKSIRGATGAELSRARSAKAEVIKAEADNAFGEDGDTDRRMDGYRKALAVFGTPADPEGVLAKSRMMLEVAHELRRSEPEQAREYCDTAGVDLAKKRDELSAALPKGPVRAALFNSMFYYRCYSFYVKALTYDAADERREANLRLAEAECSEFDFDNEGVTREFLLINELRGDISLARGDLERAVVMFLDLVNFLSGSSGYDAGVIALQHGYLRAAALLTTELDYEPRNLEKAVALYGEALDRYGRVPELEYWFKRFQLFRISALIKQGRAENIRGAVDLLFKLAADRDPVFRRNALSVLGDVATRPELDDALRFRCAETVYSELSTNPVSVILRNIQAYQVLLANCNDVTKFETYAPACFARIGDMYSSMWRFLDAVHVYREATYRTAYFRDKFASVAAVPEHMRNRCPLIKDPESLAGFPGEMAAQAQRHARLVVDARYGDPSNRELKRLADDMEKLKAEFGDKSALLDLEFDRAFALFTQKLYARSAVKNLRLPATYRKAHIATYRAAKAYYLLADDSTALRFNQSGPEDERESDDFFKDQQQRHQIDLAGLPPSLWTGVEAGHLKAIRAPETRDNVANWHKAAYYYKKYFLLEAQRAWQDIEPMLSHLEAATLSDAMRALADLRNGPWLAANPSGRGEPDPDMRRMALAAYDLAYLLRNPPRNAAESTQLKAEGRDLALAILRPFWSMYGYHISDNALYRKGAPLMAFNALAEARNADACEQIYLAFKESYPEDQANILGMEVRLYGLVRDEQQPRTEALVKLSDALYSRAAVLKKNQFERISEAGFPQDAKRLAEAKTRHERQQVLAQHFWNEWMLKRVFQAQGAAAISEYMATVQSRVEQRWNAMEKEYTTRWGDSLRSELAKLLKHKDYSGIRAQVEQIAQGDNLTLLERLEQAAAVARSAGKSEDEKLLRQLITAISLNTDELQFFQGAVFIYEFGALLEELAQDAIETAKPAVARILKYLEPTRVAAGTGLHELGADALHNTGRHYFLIGDWKTSCATSSWSSRKTGPSGGR